MAKFGFKGGLVAMALGAAFVVGCGDDGTDGGNGNEGGDGGTSTAGKGGTSAGSNSDGGKAGGGTAGTSNEAGAGATDAMGGGGSGSDPEPVGGAGADGGGGEGGSPTEPTVFAPITEVDSNVYAKANDLRGVTFSESGKIWASGHIGINANPTTVADPDKKLVIARFKADGSPDETFSGDGFLEINLVEKVLDETDPQNVKIINDGNEESLGIVELGDGDIIVSGNKRDANGKGMDAYLARFHSDGEPVSSFGTAGVAIVTFGWAPTDDAAWTATSPAAPSDSSYGIALDRTGAEAKVVLFGAGTALKGSLASNVQRTDNDRYVTRLLASTGAIDPGFNSSKPFTYNTGGTNGDNGRRGSVEADGSILAAGYTNFAPGGNHIVAIKLKADGTRDATFGPYGNNRGIFHSNPVINDGGVAECYQIVRQSTGRLISTGYGSATATDVLSSFGYESTKAPDLVSFAYSADGKALDTEWGNFGMFIAQSEAMNVTRFEERGRDMVVLPDDRLVYAGNFATDPAIYVAQPDGSFDPENDVGALFRYDPLTVTVNPTTQAVSTSHFFGIALSADGKRIAATTSQNVDGALLAVLEVGE